jgi:hypothetical protein
MYAGCQPPKKKIKDCYSTTKMNFFKNFSSTLEIDFEELKDLHEP